MRLIPLAMMIATLGMGCGTSPRVNWPAIAECGARDAPEELLQTVAAILLGDAGDTATTIGDRAVAQLTQLAEDRGAMLVECFVDEAVRGFDAQTPSAQALMAGPVRPLPAQLAAARGRDFLQRVAVARVERQ